MTVTGGSTWTGTMGCAATPRVQANVQLATPVEMDLVQILITATQALIPSSPRTSVPSVL